MDVDYDFLGSLGMAGFDGIAQNDPRARFWALYDWHLDTLLALFLRRHNQSLWLDHTSMEVHYMPLGLFEIARRRARLLNEAVVSRAIPQHVQRCYDDVMNAPDRIDNPSKRHIARWLFVARGLGIDPGTVAVAGPGQVQRIYFDVRRDADDRLLWYPCGDTLRVRAVLRPKHVQDLGNSSFRSKEVPLAAVRVPIVDFFNGTYMGEFRLPACNETTSVGTWTIEVVHAYHRFNAMKPFVGFTAARNEKEVNFLKERVLHPFNVAYRGLSQSCAVGASDVNSTRPPVCMGPRDDGAWLDDVWLPSSCRYSLYGHAAPQPATFDSCFAARKLCFSIVGDSVMRQLGEGLLARGMPGVKGMDHMGRPDPPRSDFYDIARLQVAAGVGRPLAARTPQEEDEGNASAEFNCFRRIRDFIRQSSCMAQAGSQHVIVLNFGVGAAAFTMHYGQFAQGLESVLMMLRVLFPSSALVWRRSTAVHPEEFDRRDEFPEDEHWIYINANTPTRIDVLDRLAMRSMQHHNITVFDTHSLTEAIVEHLQRDDTRHYDEALNAVMSDMFRTVFCEGSPNLAPLRDRPTLRWQHPSRIYGSNP